jgi:hypothetical protein
MLNFLVFIVMGAGVVFIVFKLARMTAKKKVESNKVGGVGSGPSLPRKKVK